MSDNPDPVPSKRENETDSEQPPKRQRVLREKTFLKNPASPPNAVEDAEFSRCFEKVENKIGKNFKPYDMKSAQSAQTSIKYKKGDVIKFQTRAQKHSEMCAIEHLIANKHVTLTLSGSDVTVNGSEVYTVDPANFETEQPHCGYCTFILCLLGFPLGTPSQGKFNQSINLSYPIPKELCEPNIVYGTLFCKDLTLFVSFIKRHFFNNDVDVNIDVTGNNITVNGADFRKLDDFLKDHATGQSATTSRSYFIWKCFFNYLNARLNPEK